MSDKVRIRIGKKDNNTYLFNEYRTLGQIDEDDILAVLLNPERYNIEVWYQVLGKQEHQ